MSLVSRPLARLGRTQLKLILLSRCAAPTSIQRRNNSSAEGTPISLKNIAGESTSFSSAVGIHKKYYALVAQAQKSDGQNLEAGTIDSLHHVLTALGRSSGNTDMQLLDVILYDMKELFGMEPNAEIYSLITKAIEARSDPVVLLDWLQNMSRKPGHITPSRSQWHSLLEHCTGQNDIKLIQSALNAMSRSGCRFNQTTFRLAVSAYIASSAVQADFIELFSLMKKAQIHHESATFQLLSNGLRERMSREDAMLVEKNYHTQFGATRQSKFQEWANKLAEEAHTSGVKSALRLFRVLEQDGCVASPKVVNAILQHSKEPADLWFLQKELGFVADAHHWALIIRNVVRTGNMTNALDAFAAARKDGIKPDAPMVGPIVRSLCRTAVAPPTDQAINQALSLYRELVNNEDLDTMPIGPDIDIYQSLLRAMASSPNVIAYYHVALSLLRDMEARQLTVGDSLTATSVTILLMQNSTSFAEAFDIYRRLHFSLDATGYGIILNAFSKLSFAGDVSIPPLDLYFEIVKDMRKNGYNMTVEVYTILLGRLGRLATQANQSPGDSYIRNSLREKVAASIRRTHNLLVVDATLSPDAPLWNQLMDAYQRAGCYPEAYRVWDMIYLARRFNHASVSIILDACGFAHSWPAASHVSARLFRDGFYFNQQNWNAWLECLCRLGRLNDALKVLCVDMKEAPGDIAPDEPGARVLLTFARRMKQFDVVASRIRAHLPDLWDSLPSDLHQP